MPLSHYSAPPVERVTEIERMVLTADFARMKRYVRKNKHIPILFRKAGYK
jgi:hypothetical protein